MKTLLPLLACALLSGCGNPKILGIRVFDDPIAECLDLGFKPDTDPYRNCVLVKEEGRRMRNAIMDSAPTPIPDVYRRPPTPSVYPPLRR